MDADGSRMILGSCLAAAFLTGGAFFSALKTRIIEMNDQKLKSQAAQDSGAKLLYELTQSPTRLMCTFSVCRRMTRLFVFLSVTVGFYLPLSEWLCGVFEAEENISSAAFCGAASAAVLYLSSRAVTVLLSEYLPKQYALKHKDDSYAKKHAASVRRLSIALRPFTAAATLMGGFAGEVLGVHMDETGEAITEEEILMMVDAGNETGVIEQSQREMISNIFDFDDLTVSDVMTHRTNIIGVEQNTSISEIVYAAINHGRSRIPVYNGDMDSIIGIIYVKDLLCLVGQENTDGFNIKEFIREVIYTPETNSCAEVFRQMTSTKTQMAIVVDEYGGTAGLVTMEDLLESIVGNIQDEYDNEAEAVTEISDGVYTISGAADFEEVFIRLGLSMPGGDEENEFDTMSGFMVSRLGRIPQEGESPRITYGDVQFTVLLSDDKKIIKIKAVRQTEENPS